MRRRAVAAALLAGAAGVASAQPAAVPLRVSPPVALTPPRVAIVAFVVDALTSTSSFTAPRVERRLVGVDAALLQRTADRLHDAFAAALRDAGVEIVADDAVRATAAWQRGGVASPLDRALTRQTRTTVAARGGRIRGSYELRDSSIASMAAGMNGSIVAAAAARGVAAELQATALRVEIEVEFDDAGPVIAKAVVRVDAPGAAGGTVMLTQPVAAPRGAGDAVTEPSAIGREKVWSSPFQFQEHDVLGVDVRMDPQRWSDAVVAAGSAIERAVVERLPAPRS